MWYVQVSCSGAYLAIAHALLQKHSYLWFRAIRSLVLFLGHFYYIIGNLSTHVFETRTATGSELFSFLTCFHTTTFTLLSIFSPLEMISTKIWEIPLSWHVRCSLPVAVRVSKMRVLKLPNVSHVKHSLAFIMNPIFIISSLS